MLKHTNFIFCPKCGSKDIKEYTVKALLCNSCKFQYYHNSASAVAGFIEYDDMIILTERAVEPRKGYLDMPGGFVDYNESFEDALIRETMEELNIEITYLNYFGSIANKYPFNDINYFTTDVYFICKALSIDNIKPKDDIADYILIRPFHVNLNRICFDSTKTMITRYISSLNSSARL